MMNFKFKTKNNKELFNFHQAKIPYISYKALDDLGFVRNAFTLRKGQNSLPVKLFWNEKENPDEVRKWNIDLTRELKTDLSRRVSAVQEHTSNVHVVRESDAGSDLVKSHIDFTDALVTNIPGMLLVISVADCIPLCFADPVKRVIGLAHSGRVGTMNKIGAETVKTMSEYFGSDPKDIKASIGPGICANCYEVGDEIKDEFSSKWGSAAAERVLKKRGAKYHLDLWAANKAVLINAGLKEENITVTNICNRCNSDKFYSFRGDGRIVNQIAACLMIQADR